MNTIKFLSLIMFLFGSLSLSATIGERDTDCDNINPDNPTVQPGEETGHPGGSGSGSAREVE